MTENIRRKEPRCASPKEHQPLEVGQGSGHQHGNPARKLRQRKEAPELSGAEAARRGGLARGRSGFGVGCH